MCACGHGALCFRRRAPQRGTCQQLCLLLAENSPARGLEALTGRGGGGCLRLNKKGQQSSDVITALWGQGEIRVSWLVNNWAETGLCCCQQVAFTAARILHAMRVAAIVRLSTRAPPKVFLTVSFLQRGNVRPAARLDGVPWGFCKPQELPLFALCKVLGHVQDQSQGFSQWQVLCGNN